MAEETEAAATIRRFHALEGMKVWISGTLDEHFPADAFASAEGLVVIDLGGVRRITSFGIREWSRAMLALATSKVYFVEVSEAMLAQFAMVAGLAGGGQILSYQATFDCARCAATTTRTFDRRTDEDSIWDAAPPQRQCAACGQTMSFTGIAESHRVALVRSGPLRVDPALATVAAAGQPAAAPVPAATGAPGKLRLKDAVGARGKLSQVSWIYPFEVHKQVVGDTTVLWLSGTLDAVAGFRQVADGIEGRLVIAARDITASDEAGIAVFAKLCHSASGALLARCAPVLAAALARAPQALGPARLVSVEHAITCTACKMDHPYFSTIGATGEKGVFCPRCAAPCELDNYLVSDAIEKLACAPAPPWLAPLVKSPPRHLRSQVLQVLPPPRKPWPALIAAGAVLVVALATGVYLTTRGPRGPRLVEDHAPPTAPTAELEQAVATTTGIATRPPERIDLEPTTIRGSSGDKPRAVGEVTASVPTAKAPARDVRRLGDVLDSGRRLGDTMPPTESEAPALPAQLTRAQIDASMAAIAGEVGECYERFQVAGKALVRGTIGPSGRLQGVEVAGLLAGTPTGACVERAARHSSFPRFAGPPIPVTYPYDLR